MDGLSSPSSSSDGVRQRERPFVHFEIDQIAVNITSEDWANKWCDKVNEVCIYLAYAIMIVFEAGTF